MGARTIWVVTLMTLPILTGCASSPRAAGAEAPAGVAAPGGRETLAAGWVDDRRVTVDGRLDEPFWRDADVRTLEFILLPHGQRATEPATVRAAWTPTRLIVGVDCQDADIVAEGNADQLYHYRLGDTVELFLKPAASTWYWELYGTPTGNKTRLLWPGRGYRGLNDIPLYGRPGPEPQKGSGAEKLQVAASVRGTVNAWRDTDQGWSVEFAVHRSELESLGDEFGPGAGWLIFIGRYNYGRDLPNLELGHWPRLPLKSDFHSYEHFASLVLEEPTPSGAAAGEGGG